MTTHLSLTGWLRLQPVCLRTASGAWADLAFDLLDLFGIKPDGDKPLRDSFIRSRTGGVLCLDRLRAMGKDGRVRTPERAAEALCEAGYIAEHSTALLVAALEGELHGSPVYPVGEHRDIEHGEDAPTITQTAEAWCLGIVAALRLATGGTGVLTRLENGKFEWRWWLAGHRSGGSGTFKIIDPMHEIEAIDPTELARKPLGTADFDAPEASLPPDADSFNVQAYEDDGQDAGNRRADGNTGILEAVWTVGDFAVTSLRYGRENRIAQGQIKEIRDDMAKVDGFWHSIKSLKPMEKALL